MKQFGLILGVCFGVVIVVLGGVFAYHSMYGVDRAAERMIPGYDVSTGKAVKGNGFDKTAGTSGTAAPASLSSANDMLKELQATLDDEGASDFSAIEAELSQL